MAFLSKNIEDAIRNRLELLGSSSPLYNGESATPHLSCDFYIEIGDSSGPLLRSEDFVLTDTQIDPGGVGWEYHSSAFGMPQMTVSYPQNSLTIMVGNNIGAFDPVSKIMKLVNSPFSRNGLLRDPSRVKPVYLTVGLILNKPTLGDSDYKLFEYAGVRFSYPKFTFDPVNQNPSTVTVQFVAKDVKWADDRLIPSYLSY